MRAFVIEGYKKDPTFIERPMPKIRDNEVLVEVHAASINPLDTKHALAYTETGKAKGKVILKLR